MITTNIFWAILGSTVVATVTGVLLNWIKENFQNRNNWKLLSQEKLYGSLTYNLLMIRALDVNRSELLTEISKEPTQDNTEEILKKYNSVNPINNQWRQHIQNIKSELEFKAGYIRSEHQKAVEIFLDAYIKREITDGGKSRHATKERIEKIFDSIGQLQKEILGNESKISHSLNDDVLGIWVGIWGIVLSLVGTLYISFSSFEHLGMYVVSANGREFHGLLLDPVLFKMSLWIIGAGFFIQLLEKLWNKIQIRYRGIVFYTAVSFSMLLILYISFYRFFGVF